MERTGKQVLSVALALIPLYGALALAGYWTLVDTHMPMDLVYQHDHFLTEPATSREEAKRHEVQEIIGGSMVYVYREICATVSEHIHVEAAWTSNAMIWQAPVRSFPLVKGCAGGRSYQVVVPSSNPARDLVYSATWRRDNNPLVTTSLAAPPIHIRALPPKGDK